jgi:hypothetical protein
MEERLSAICHRPPAKLRLIAEGWRLLSGARIGGCFGQNRWITIGFEPTKRSGTREHLIGTRKPIGDGHVVETPPKLPDDNAEITSDSCLGELELEIDLFKPGTSDSKKVWPLDHLEW